MAGHGNHSWRKIGLDRKRRRRVAIDSLENEILSSENQHIMKTNLIIFKLFIVSL